MESTKSDAGPLSGILVADFSRVLAGPLCTMMLGDAGARVIKVEEPERGDETRLWGPPFVAGESSYFLSVNRNKESITLDLKTDRGRQIARKLIERADVVIDNFRRPQRERLGLGSEHVRAINPQAICCSIIGYDSDTPETDLPGYDLLAQAGAGLMAITGEPGGPPMKVGVALADVLTGHYAHGAILAGLYAREKTGEGSSIEVSIFGSTVASLINVAQAHLLTGTDAKRHGNQHPSIVPYQSFDAADRPFVIGAGTDRQFVSLCRNVLQRPDLAEDPRFAGNSERVRNREVLGEILGDLFAQRPVTEWVEACRRSDIPAEQVNGIAEVFAGIGRRSVESIQHPTVGEYRAVRSPIRTGRIERMGAPPRLGEHTEAILRELGFE